MRCPGEVERPAQRYWMGREALREVQEGLEGPPGGLEGMWRPSGRSGRGWEALLRSGSGREALQKVREGSGGHL